MANGDAKYNQSASHLCHLIILKVSDFARASSSKSVLAGFMLFVMALNMDGEIRGALLCRSNLVSFE